MEKINLLGISINSLTIEEVRVKIEENLKKEKKYEKGYVVTPNVSHIVMLQKDKEFRKAYKKAWLTLVDGTPIIWLSKIIGKPLKSKCSGADLINVIFDICDKNKSKVFLLGGTNGTEKIAEEKIIKFYNNIVVSSLSPSFGFEEREDETSNIIEKINKFKPDILLLFVGAPKSEKWIYRNFDKIEFKMAFCLGAALDFFAGTKKRAPLWMQKIGLEWLFRLIQEPRRLWKRYLIGNTVFIFLVIKEVIKKIFFKKF